MRSYGFTVDPGASTIIKVSGNYLRVRVSGVDLNVRAVAEDEAQEFSFMLSAGDDFRLENGRFKTIEVRHADIISQPVEVIIGSGVKISSAKVSGIVSLSGSVNLGLPTQGSGAQSVATVTNVAAQLVASNLARKYLLIQNRDAAGTVFINFNGVATPANGIEIPARSEREWDCNVLTGAISAIGNLATQSNVIVLEG